MPPRRPPPLPQGLFAPQGPLAPGSAPLPPSPSTIHPTFIVDAHSGDKDLSADNLSLSIRSIKVDAIQPTILDLTCSAASQAANVKASASKGKTLDVVIGSTRPLDEKEWETLEEIISILDGGWGEGGDDASLGQGQGQGLAGTKIVISGLLPPPLTKPSSPLLNDEVYGLHLARLAALSLHSDVYLKALPPVVDDTTAGAGAGESWWSDIKELERVLRMYVSPAIGTFGTHRIIFGSSPALLPSGDSVKYPINDPSEWYKVIRKVITELGERQDELTDVMGQNGVKVYGL